MLDSERRRWLMRAHGAQREPLRALASRSSGASSPSCRYAEGFESFLHTKYLGAKRFSLEGGESLIPMLDMLLEEGGALGIQEIVIGMAHRGRLNVLANILGKNAGSDLQRVRRAPRIPSAYLGRGDVKYHLGFSLGPRHARAAQNIHLSLAFNPSHLECVDPVVRGPRARQAGSRRATRTRTRVVPLLIHGDAAFTGQGVVAETLNLSGLRGYPPAAPSTSSSTTRSASPPTRQDAQLQHLLHRHGADARHPHLPRERRRPRGLRPRDAPGDRVPPARSRATWSSTCLLPPLRPQRGRRARVHPAADVRADPQRTPPCAQIYAQDAGASSGRIDAEEAEAHQAAGACRASTRRTPRAQGSSAVQGARARCEGLWKRYTRRRRTRTRPQVGHRRARGRGCASCWRSSATVPAGLHAAPKRQAHGARPAPGRWPQGKEPLDWAAGETLAYATLLAEGYARAPHRPGHRARHLQPPPRRAARREDRRDATRRCATCAGQQAHVRHLQQPAVRDGRAGLRVRLQPRLPRRPGRSGRRSSATSPTAPR